MSRAGRDHADSEWQAFQRLPKMANHWWWRPGWSTGRRFYTWHLTFDKSRDVQQLARTYQDAINLDFLDPVPARGLHLTMQGIGFADEVDPEDIAAVVDAASDQLASFEPFELTVGPAYADREGVPLAVDPWEQVTALRSAVRDAIAKVRGHDRVPEQAEGFVPHITLFYSNSEADPAPLRAALGPLRDLPPVRTRIDAVSLIKLARDTHEYEWTTEADVRLGAPPREAP